jgi:signal transduction histidine kinase
MQEMSEQKILIIDDNEDDRLLYRRTLKKNGDGKYNIIETDEGEEGLRFASTEQPDCILLDYSMPGRNGLEVLKDLRQQNPFVPVVMLTGQGNETVAVNAMQQGAQNYITKSTINSESLTQAIRTAIENCALQKRIEEQRQSLEIFTHALAHDLKEPVRTIRSFVDLVSRHVEIKGKAEEYFKFISDAADRMAALIDTVYFYTRLDGSEPQIATEVCDVNQALEDAKGNLTELIRERKALITCDSLPQIRANRMQMIQMLQNLISNAIQHSEGHPVIHLSGVRQDRQWTLSIKDNGPGISPDFGDKIFEPFRRSSKQAKGLGLGLAICKKIMEHHKGRIWYESKPGGGTIFFLSFPDAAGMPVGEKANASQAPINGTKTAMQDKPLANLLLVEDNKADLELARIMLMEDAKLQCNLLVATDGYEALDILHGKKHQTEPIDLILLDINMPKMDGFELLEKMR